MVLKNLFIYVVKSYVLYTYKNLYDDIAGKRLK